MTMNRSSMEERVAFLSHCNLRSHRRSNRPGAWLTFEERRERTSSRKWACLILPVHTKMGGQGSKDFKADCSNVLIGHEDTVTCCVFSPNEKLLATCSTDRRVIVWDFRKNRAVYTLEQHKAPVTSCCFSANSRILISSGLDKMLAVWDMEKGVLMRKYGGHEGGVLFCVYAPGSDFLFATACEVSLQHAWWLHVVQCKSVRECACVRHV